MPQHAMTVSPEYNDEGQLVDMQVSGGRTGGSVDPTIVEDNEGRLHYQYETQDRDPESIAFEAQDYTTLLVEAYPELPMMVQFANTDSSGLPETFVDEWNDILNSDYQDMDRFHVMLEQLQEAYAEYQQNAPVEMSETEQWFDQMPQEEADAIADHVIDNPVSIDDAQVLSDLHGQFEPGSAEDFIIRAGVDVAYGKADTQAMMQEAFEKYGAAEAYKAYMQLSQLINQ